MADNRAAIAAFLASKGLNAAQVAGILGNLQIESGFNPNAHNANEGAIGIVQWEGGRRTNLQRYAASIGKTETDLSAQLGYLWQELTGPYASVYQQLKGMNDPGAIAALWDQRYEVSSGNARAQRISAAQSIYGNGSLSAMTAGASVPAGTAAASSAGASDSSAYGFVGQLAASVPEIAVLLQQATSQNWSPDRFTMAVAATNWWKTHSDTARRYITEQQTDPAKWQQDWKNAAEQVQQLANRMGMGLKPGDAASIATQYLMGGWDEAALREYIGKKYQGDPDHATGEYANNLMQARQLNAAYGGVLADVDVQKYVQGMAIGQYPDTGGLQARMQQIAASAFPAYADQIKAGQTIDDISAGFRNAMAQTLEMDPGSITSRTQEIRQALTSVGEDGKPTQTPLWQFEQTLRKDPRWDQTDQATSQAASMVRKIGQDWGFAS